MTTPTTRDLTKLPKAHLHLHFTGSMHPDSLRSLALRHDKRLPQALLDDEPLRVPADQRGWFRFQRLYDAARACVRDESDMRRIVDEAVLADKLDGSGRLEIQIDPTSYASRLGGITPTLEIVLDESSQAARRHGIDVGVIVAASRIRHPLDARALARLAAQHAGDGPGQVIGFGLSNDEHAGRTEDFAPAFRIAARADLALVPHGGELRGPDHVMDVLRHLAPDRIGHGIRLAEDLRLLDEVVARGVGLEVCPASNVALGVYPDLEAVPVRTLAAHGAQIALGADDPLLFARRLSDQYQSLRDLDWSDEELADLARSSIRISMARDSVKQQLLQGVDDWLAAPTDSHETATAVND